MTARGRGLWWKKQNKKNQENKTMGDYKFGTWYPIETAPRSNDWVLTVERDGEVNVSIWGRHPLDTCGDMSMCWTTGYLAIDPTHWMPLPAPPSQDLLLFPEPVTASTQPPSKGGDWPGFDQFWALYPKKEAKKTALKSWNKEKPDLTAVIKALDWQKSSRAWKDGFIPMPTTYLNQRRWEDERTQEPKPEQIYQ